MLSVISPEPDHAGPVNLREQILAFINGRRRHIAMMAVDVSRELRLHPTMHRLVDRELAELADAGLVVSVQMLGLPHYRRRGTIAGLAVELERGGSIPATAVFHPSSVRCPSPMGFVDMFGRAEAEQYAWLMVHALAQTGDRWRPITPAEVVDLFQETVEEHGAPSWLGNPFFKPDARVLIESGLATFAGEALGSYSPISFTLGAVARFAASKWRAPLESTAAEQR